jgi:small subunit ribosomal protein S1
MNDNLIPKFGVNKIARVLLKYNYKVKKADILAGSIIGIERRNTLINVGLNQVGFLPHEEILFQTKSNPTKILKPNEFGEFVILDYESNTNKTIVSLRRLHYLRLWERFKQIDFKNMILFTKPENNIWGGKLVNFDGLKIFIPNFHLPKYYRRKNAIDNILPMKILEVKDKNYQLIGSSKLAILKKQSPSVHVGLIQEGYVLCVKPFGIFLNIYGLKCLLHISEISNKKIENLNAIYKKGDRILVKIIYINSSQGKIAVSAKHL